MGQVIIHTFYIWSKCLYQLLVGHWTTAPQAFYKIKSESVWSKHICWLASLCLALHLQDSVKDPAHRGNLGVGDKEKKEWPLRMTGFVAHFKWNQEWFFNHWPLMVATARRVLGQKVKEVDPGLSGFPFLSPGWDWEALPKLVCLLTNRIRSVFIPFSSHLLNTYMNVKPFVMLWLQPPADKPNPEPEFVVCQLSDFRQVSSS